MLGRNLVMACAAVLLATGGLVIASTTDGPIRVAGIPSAATCEEGSCYVAVGEYVLRIAGDRGDAGVSLLAEAEEAHKRGKTLSYVGHGEIAPDGFPSIRRGRLVLVGARG